jgi:hypothetical protein
MRFCYLHVTMNGEADEFDLTSKTLTDAIERVASRWHALGFVLDIVTAPPRPDARRSITFNLWRREDLGGQYRLLRYGAGYAERSGRGQVQSVETTMTEEILSLGNVSRYVRLFNEEIPVDFLSELALEHAWIRLAVKIREARPASIAEVLDRANVSP